VALRDDWRKHRGRRFVNYCLTILSILMRRAAELGLVTDNAVEKVVRIPRDKNATQRNRPWSERERHAVWERTGTERYAHLRLPLAIGLYLGLREADMIKLPPIAIRGGQLALETAKRKVWIDLPLLPELATAIAASGSDAIRLCVNSQGRPWSQDGFRASFFKMIKALEAEGLVEPGLTYHGLRPTVASLMAERGVSMEDIAAVLGQKSSRVAAHYAARADRSRRAGEAIRKLRPLKRAKK
jgi:integrase